MKLPFWHYRKLEVLQTGRPAQVRACHLFSKVSSIFLLSEAFRASLNALMASICSFFSWKSSSLFPTGNHLTVAWHHSRHCYHVHDNTFFSNKPLKPCCSQLALGKLRVDCVKWVFVRIKYFLCYQNASRKITEQWVVKCSRKPPTSHRPMSDGTKCSALRAIHLCCIWYWVRLLRRQISGSRY